MTGADVTPDQGFSKKPPTRGEFARLLSRRIESAIANPKELRQAVYEVARIKLLEQFGREDTAEVRPALQALEAAIQEVERTYDQKPREPIAPPRGQLASPIPDRINAIPPAPAKPARPAPPSVPERSPERRPRTMRTFASIARLGLVLLAALGCWGAVLYWPQLQPSLRRILTNSPFQRENRPTTMLSDGTGPEQNTPADQAPKSQPSPAPEVPAQAAGVPSLPLPSAFGTYALSDGQLLELRPLPGKVPDRRVGVSAPISTPSQTTIPNGDVKFIVFRNDPEMKATNSTEVRVVAKVSRAMAVNSSGKATIAPTGNSWVIRGVSLPFKIGPIENQPQMLLAQAETAGLVLEPGRYVFVIKGLGFDFTVAGEITSPDQCLERVDAANGAFYSPCPGRQPPGNGPGRAKGP